MSKPEKADKYITAFLRHQKRFVFAHLAVAAFAIMVGSAVLLLYAVYEVISCALQGLPMADCLSRGIDNLPGILMLWGFLLFIVLLSTPLCALFVSVGCKKNPVLNILRNQPECIIECRAFPDTFPLFTGAGRGLSIFLRPLGLLARKIIGQELYILSLRIRTVDNRIKTMNIQLLKNDAVRFSGEYNGWTWFGS